MPLTDELLRAALDRTLDATDLDASAPSTKAKSATTTRRTTAGAIIVVTDRISAFDRVLGTLPLKGRS